MIEPLKIEGSQEIERSDDWLCEMEALTKIDLSKKVPRPDSVLTIGSRIYKGKRYGIDVFTAGEISVISAPSKSKKTRIKSAFVAAILNGNLDKRFSEIKGYRKEKKVIDIDTEQGIYYALMTMKNAEKMAEGNINGYCCYGLRKLDNVKDRVDFIDKMLKKDGRNVRVMFIDGLADLVSNANDLVMSTEIVGKLRSWTAIYNIHICIVIHNAFGQLKPTGHLGSSICKAAETLFFLSPKENDDNVIEVTCGYSRGFPFPSFAMQLDEDGLPFEYKEEVYNSLIGRNDLF